jgi:serine/threonine-protein kinase
MAKLSQEAAARGFPTGTVVDGRYKIVRFIGQGGAGLVHEVEHVRTGRRLAMKTLLDEAGYARLEQEAKATSLMQNPHAVKITDMGTAAGVAAGPYLVMELLEGQSLRALLDDAGQLPVELTVNIALQVCECLAEAHASGIIHRDLKPENVILTPSPWPGQHDVKVLDFGVVKINAIDGPIPHSSLTRTGSTVGTPYYMSLEQLRNSSAVDARADIYALGVVLYESLSGRKPFEADTIGDLVYALCSGPPTQLSRLRPDAPAEVCQVVMRALSMNRDDRQASMEEIATTLIPFGNQAFGLWTRAEARRPESLPKRVARPLPAAGQRAAANEAAPEPPVPRPAAGAPAKPGPAIPRPVTAAASAAAPAAVPAPVTAPAPAAAPAPSAPRAATPDSSSAIFSRPVIADDVDDGHGRDTPTEMYTTSKHPDVEQPSAGDRDTPTRALEARPVPTSDPGYPRLTAPLPTPDPEALRVADEPRQLDTPYAQFVSMPTAPAPVEDSGVSMVNPTIRIQSPAESTFPSRALGASLNLQDAPANAKPAWQQSLDRVLVRVGNSLERVGSGAVGRFRQASPRAQLAIAVSGASLLAAALVLLLYLLLR